MNPSQITQAQSLEEIYLTTQNSPLTTEAEIMAFYRDEVNTVRGGDKVQRLRLGLIRSHQNRTFFKAIFMGHQGVGKSTELSRLVNQITQQFAVLRFSAVNTLDPVNFKPLDVVLIMMADIAEQTYEKIGQAPSEDRLKEIWNWFATEKETRESSRSTGIAIDGGAGVKEGSLWGKILGLFANLKGEIKFAAIRKKEITEHRVSRLDDLIEILNRLLDDCNDLLRQATGQEWLFIGEDFDRANIPIDRIEELFITNAEVFHTMRTHLIFSLPISLYYSGKGAGLPFSDDQSIVLPDTPVFTQDHKPSLDGRAALIAVLNARIKPDIFDANQIERVIIASGGNLRDLFSLVNYAADTAQLRSGKTVSQLDVDGAIVHLRSAYERRLGQSPYDSEKVTYQNKADRLKKIYDGDSKAQVADEVIYSLLRSRAVQEFNGQRWFGVHPLVVDILVKQKEITKQKKGGVPGGTE
jgi:hypothetical protein